MFLFFPMTFIFFSTILILNSDTETYIHQELPNSISNFKQSTKTIDLNSELKKYPIDNFDTSESTSEEFTESETQTLSDQLSKSTTESTEKESNHNFDVNSTAKSPLLSTTMIIIYIIIGIFMICFVIILVLRIKERPQNNSEDGITPSVLKCLQLDQDPVEDNAEKFQI